MKDKIFKVEYLKNLTKASLPPTIITIIILLLGFKYFGIDNLLIAPYMSMTYIRMKNYVDVDKGYVKPFIVHIVIGIVASIAGLNFINAIVINFVGGMVITYFLTDEYNPTSYFPYLMAFVFLQLFPCTFDKIPLRILAIAVSYGILLITLKIARPKHVTSKIEILLNEGLSNIANQFITLGKGEMVDFSKDQFKLFEICKDMNRIIYLSGRKKYYSFVILFQHFNNIINDVIQRGELISKNKEYFKNLADLFMYIKYMAPKREFNYAIEKIYNFIPKENFTDEDLDNYFKFLLSYTISAMEELKVEENRGIFKEIKDFFEGFKNLSHYKITLNGFKIRFAFRISLLLSLSFGFVSYFNFNKDYWIPMTIFLLTMPFYEDSKKRAFLRFKGTLFGILLSFILFSIFKSFESHMIIVVISAFFMYAYSDFMLLTFYVTFFAVALSTIGVADDYKVIALRFLYTFIAILLVLFANAFIFPNKAGFEMKSMIKRLVEINKEMLYELREILNENINQEKVRELVYESYLVSAKLQSHNTKKVDEKDINTLNGFIFNNNKLTTLLGHEAYILEYADDGKIDKGYTLASIEELEIIFNQMEDVLNKKYRDKGYYEYTRVRRILRDNSFINIQITNCVIKGADSLVTLKRLVELL